tara:strand:- start:254 stop:472 length:219 start_codon:yes stop_codon:yes gene_type:complete
MPFLKRAEQIINVSDGVEVRYIKEGWKLISRDEANGISEPKPDPVPEPVVEPDELPTEPIKPKTRRTTRRAK